MPSRYIVKNYLKNGIYHVYNRGVEKRQIFMDDQDYRVMLYGMKHYLSPPEKPQNSTEGMLSEFFRDDLMNLHGEIDLLAFSLMPNHFHLLLKQKTETGMTKLLHRISTRYAIYFNRRHQRVGALFQGAYKAIELDLPQDILFLSFYLHFNSFIRKSEGKVVLQNILSLDEIYKTKTTHTSLPYFLKKMKADWIKPDFVLEQLKNLMTPFRSYDEYIERCQKEFGEMADLSLPKSIEGLKEDL